jgi:hypothetical protein
MIKQVTLRGIPDRVGKGLRDHAARTGHSLNRTTIELLEQALGVKATDGKKRDLSRLAGQWSREECGAFDRNTRIFEQIDDELWSK